MVHLRGRELSETSKVEIKENRLAFSVGVLAAESSGRIRRKVYLHKLLGIFFSRGQENFQLENKDQFTLFL